MKATQRRWRHRPPANHPPEGMPKTREAPPVRHTPAALQIPTLAKPGAAAVKMGVASTAAAKEQLSLAEHLPETHRQHKCLNIYFFIKLHNFSYLPSYLNFNNLWEEAAPAARPLSYVRNFIHKICWCLIAQIQGKSTTNFVLAPQIALMKHEPQIR